ncbi:MAG: Oxidoreductase, GMC family, partial [uncultured Blastococcus sp.]
DRRGVRRRRRGRRVGRLRAGRPAVGGPDAERAAAGGGRLRQAPRGPDPGGAVQELPHPAGLELHDRAAGGPGRPEAVLAARQAARRLVLDQRDDLHARRRARLRRVGAADRRPRLVLRPRAAAVPPDGGQLARGRPLPRRRRAAARGGPALAAPVDPRRRRVRGGRRPPPQRRLQRRCPRRRRALPGDPAAGPSLVVGRCLPASRDAAPEPDRAHRRAHHPGAAGERPGHRCGVPGGRAGAHRPRDARGRALRRRGELPAAADALGHRPGRPPARGRRRRRPRPARRGRGPAGPPAGAGRVGRALGQIAVARGVALGLRAVVRRPARTADLEPGRGGAVQPLHPGAVRGRSADALPPGQVLEAGRGRPRRRRLHRRGRPGARALARHGAAEVGRPVVVTGHRRRLPHRRAGPRRPGLRRGAGPRHRLGGPARRGAGRGVVPGRRGARPRGAPGLGAGHARVAVPPGLLLPDGHRRPGGRGPTAAGARHRGSPGGRRLGDADAGARQHQRPDDHDRGAGRRPGPGPLRRPRAGRRLV